MRSSVYGVIAVLVLCLLTGCASIVSMTEKPRPVTPNFGINGTITEIVYDAGSYRTAVTLYQEDSNTPFTLQICGDRQSNFRLGIKMYVNVNLDRNPNGCSTLNYIVE